MAMVNQQSVPIVEEEISFSYLTLEERKEAVDLLFKYMHLEIIRTNSTKHGNFELQVRPIT